MWRAYGGLACARQQGATKTRAAGLARRSKAQRVGNAMCAALKDKLGRQMFEVVIQAAANGKVVSRETLKVGARWLPCSAAGLHRKAVQAAACMRLTAVGCLYRASGRCLAQGDAVVFRTCILLRYWPRSTIN